MTPERINELRDIALRHVDFSDSAGINVDTIVPCRELLDLLATAEREAVLREALETIIAPEMWVETSDGTLDWRGVEDFMDIGRAALETKGGE